MQYEKKKCLQVVKFSFLLSNVSWAVSCGFIIFFTYFEALRISSLKHFLTAEETAGLKYIT